MRANGETPRRASNRGLVFVVVFALIVVAASGGAGALLSGSAAATLSIATVNGLSQARRLLDEGKVAEAKAIFTAELKRDPKSVEAIRGLALCARDEGDDETVLQYFQQVTMLAPKDVAAWRQQALAASRLGRSMEAVAAAQTALSLSGNKDLAMSDLMTRILTSDMDHLATPKIPGVSEPWGVDPAGHRRGGNTFDRLGDMPGPEPPDPTKGLQVVGARR